MVKNSKEYMKNYMKNRRQSKIEELVNLTHIINHNKKWIYVMNEVMLYYFSLVFYISCGKLKMPDDDCKEHFVSCFKNCLKIPSLKYPTFFKPIV